MIKADAFVKQLSQYGFSLWTGVPCSYLTPFINYVLNQDDLKYIGATNEGDAVAIAAGASLAGHKSVVMFQNSGLGNAVNPLTSLNQVFKIPALIITTLRGEPGGPKDEPQHKLMGEITTDLLELMQIPWSYFPQDEKDIEAVLKKANLYMDENQQPYALVMRKGSVAPCALEKTPVVKDVEHKDISKRITKDDPQHTRHDVLKIIQSVSMQKNYPVFASTGFSGRELYNVADTPNQLYMVGSMGCVSSLGMGYSIASNNKSVVIDGDGAALMRMGAMATIGYEKPNMVHILLDNHKHESTGGQGTVSHSIDFATIAQSCGYDNVDIIDNLEDLEAALMSETNGVAFIYMRIKSGVPENLPRPSVTPTQVCKRFKNHFLKSLSFSN